MRVKPPLRPCLWRCGGGWQMVTTDSRVFTHSKLSQRAWGCRRVVSLPVGLEAGLDGASHLRPLRRTRLVGLK